MHQCFLYIFSNKRNGILHVGMTHDLKQKIDANKRGCGDWFASKYACNNLVWYKQFPCTEEAVNREYKLQAWSRVQKRSLIEQMNPQRRDLSMQVVS